jgi:UDP-2,3-diacylglucosamine hydrolase
VSERALIVADAHLGSTPGDVEAFVAFLDSEPARGHLVLLGDLFDLWIGAPGLQTPAHRRVLEALRRRRARGARLWYVEGNRDYYLAQAFCPDPFEAVAAEALDLEIGGMCARFEHGDRINIADRAYQRWRSFSRSAPVRRAFMALPPGAAARLSGWLERRLRATNLPHRAHFPEELCRARASRAFDSGVDRLFLGHFHRGWEWRARPGGRPCRAVVVPAWQEGRSAWVWDPRGGIDELAPGGRVGGSAVSGGGASAR